MNTPQEPWEKEFDYLWQKKLNDKGYQFTHLNRPVVGNPLGGHPKAHIKAFIRDLLAEEREDRAEADIGWSEAVEKACSEARIEAWERAKVSPQAMQIPCPDGMPGCLVIHYGPDVLTTEQRSMNVRLDRLIAEERSKTETKNTNT